MAKDKSKLRSYYYIKDNNGRCKVGMCQNADNIDNRIANYKTHNPAVQEVGRITNTSVEIDNLFYQFTFYQNAINEWSYNHPDIDKLWNLCKLLIDERDGQINKLLDIKPLIDDIINAKVLDVKKNIESKPLSNKTDNNNVEVIETSQSNIEEENTKESIKQKPWFKFSMVGISIGETLTFIPTGIEVKVASDNQIKYKGKLYKLSPFVREFMPKNERNTSGAYRGSLYFSYKGKRLNDIKKEK